VAEGKTKGYANPPNPDPVLTWTVSGLVNGETTDVLTPITISRAAGENAGTYAITTAGGISQNYTTSRTDGILTIQKASPTVSISPDPIPAKIFGDAQFQLTATHSAGLPVTWASSATNVSTVNSTGLVTITGVGTSTITASHPGNSNYNAASLSRNLTVSSAQPTITFNPIPVKTYGDTNFFLSATSSAGLPLVYRSASTSVATVNLSNGLVTIRGAGTSVMTASNAATADYKFASTNQTLTVNQSLLTVTASNVSRPYGQTNPPLVFSITGFVYGEGTNVLGSQPAISTTATTNSAAGTYPITVSGGSAANYNFTNISGTLTVTAAALASNSITLTPPASLVYDGNAKAWTASAPGVSGFSLSYAGRPGTAYGPSASAPANSGDYTVTATSTDANYAGNKTENFTITKSTPVITWTNPAAITYGTPLSPVQLNASSSVAGTFDYNPTNGTVLNAGTNTLTAVFTADDLVNHVSPLTNTVSLVVDRASNVITFAALPTNKVYGDVPFGVSATASSGLLVSLVSYNTNVATLAGSNVTIQGAGTAGIRASQAGNSNYLAAASVTNTLTVSPRPRRPPPWGPPPRA